VGPYFPTRHRFCIDVRS